MSCRKVIACLNAYADGELSKKLRRTVKDHLTVCEACRKRLEDIHSLDGLLYGALPVPPVPDGLAARVMAQARRKQPTSALTRRFPSLGWNPLQWVSGLSAPMRIAACATVFLALVVGLSLDSGQVTEQNVSIEPEKNLYGLEWFDPAPPSSIGSIYVATAPQPYEEGNGR